MEVVYTASTPRCGTTYTAFMLSKLDGCTVVREPRQGFHKFIHNQSLPIPYKGWEMNGLKRIGKSHKEGKLYIESDLAFIHSTYYFVFDSFKQNQIKLIELVRNKVNQLKSLVGHKTYMDIKGERYLGSRALDPYCSYNLTIPPEGKDSVWHCAWLIYEVEERKKEIKKRYPKIKWYKFDLRTHPKDLTAWESYLNFLGLKMNKQLQEAIKTNRLINTGNRFPATVPITYSRCEEVLNKYTVIRNPFKRPRGFL